MNRVLRFAAGCFLLLAVTMNAGADNYRDPGKNDRCPVCGMFVYKYPDWVAAVEFTSGRLVYFDGAKDMFKFILDRKTYDPGHEAEKIQDVYVTDYYDLTLTDGKSALYIIGSDVYGPMGHELIPVMSDADAETFMKDHKGKRILRFDEVTRDMVWKLDE